MLTTQVLAFAELGRLFRTEFADEEGAIAVSDPDVLGDLETALTPDIGSIDQFAGVTFEPDTQTFRGKARQRISLAKTQIWSFEIAPDKMVYQIDNAADVLAFAESDIGFSELVEFRAATKPAKTKQLNCKPGNIQCGGSCKKGIRADGSPTQCGKTPTAAQKQKVQSAIAKVAPPAPAKTPATTKNKTDVPAVDRSKLPGADLELANPTTKAQRNALDKKILAAEKVGAELKAKDFNTYKANQGIFVSARVDAAVHSDENRLRALQDKKGNVQAIASVREKKTSLHVEYLATSPWNVKPGDPRYTRGAGTRMMEEFIRESVAKGKGGRITLEALPGAVSFYKKIGFTNKGQADGYMEGVVSMTLTPKAAREFMQRRGITDFAEDEADDYNEELLKLEDEAQGAFCTGQNPPDNEEE